MENWISRRSIISFTSVQFVVAGVDLVQGGGSVVWAGVAIVQLEMKVRWNPGKTEKLL